MSKILYILVLLMSNSVFAGFDPNVVKGQWGVYQSDNASTSYYFLVINDDLSGTLIRSFSGDTVVRSFPSENVIFHDGYVEIRLSKNEKAVLSAWKLKSGSGRLTGQIFMYKQDGILFNMMYFPLDLLTPDHKYLKEEVIRDLSEKFKQT